VYVALPYVICAAVALGTVCLFPGNDDTSRSADSTAAAAAASGSGDADAVLSGDKISVGPLSRATDAQGLRDDRGGGVNSAMAMRRGWATVRVNGPRLIFSVSEKILKNKTRLRYKIPQFTGI